MGSAGSRCVVKQKMQLNFDEHDEETLTIFVRNQNVVGSTELGRAEIVTQELQSMIEKPSSMHDPEWGRNALSVWPSYHVARFGYRHGLSRRRGSWRRCSPSTTSPLAENLQSWDFFSTSNAISLLLFLLRVLPARVTLTFSPLHSYKSYFAAHEAFWVSGASCADAELHGTLPG